MKRSRWLILLIALVVVGSGAWAASKFWGPPTRAGSGLSQTAVEKTPDVPTHPQEESTTHSHEEDSQPVNVNDPLGGHAHFIAVQSGTNRLLLGAHSGLLQSVDEGKSWSKIEVQGELDSTDFMNLVIDPANPDVMYAGGHDLSVVKSIDGGRTWKKANAGLAGTDIHALTYDARFQRLFAFSVGYGIFESRDGGMSWQRKDDGPRNPNVQSFAFLDVPSDMEQSMGKEFRGYLFAGTAGGVFRANPCFCGWTPMGEKLFQYSTVYTMTASLSEDALYAGTKDGLFKSVDAGETWTQILSGQKIVGLAISATNPQVLYAVSEDGASSEAKTQEPLGNNRTEREEINMTQQYTHPEVLVETAWVADHLKDPNVRIAESDEDYLLYETGHIAGAVKVDWFTILQDPLRRDFIDKKGFEKLMSEFGVRNDTMVIFYGDKSNWFACYAFWLFELYGHEKKAIMNGGRAKWTAEGRPFDKEIARYAATNYQAKDPRSGIRAFRDDVFKHLDKKLPLVDVRSPQEYRGELLHMPGYPQEGAMRGGHIPGAKSIPWSQAVREDQTFKSVDELKKLYESQGIIPAKDIIAYCRIGERSSHSWFVLKYLLGYPKVRNYDGSWTEWGNLVGAPIEKP